MPAVWREQSCTFWSLSLTAELSPAQSGWPHATTDLSTRIAANAPAVPCTCCTFWSWFWTVCRRPKKHGPMWQPIHSPRLQQMPALLPQLVGHCGADFGLQNCYLRSLDSPKWSHCLHFAMQRPCVLLLPLVGAIAAQLATTPCGIVQEMSVYQP